MDSKISFLLPVASQPRFWRRINKLTSNSESYIFSFEREYFKGDTKQNKYINLGKIEHGTKLKRIYVYFLAIFKLYRYRKRIKESKHIYIFGPDLALFYIIFGAIFNIKTPFIYEVGDVRGVFLKKDLIGKLARLVEGEILKRTEFLVLTSPYYLQNHYMIYYRNIESKVYVLENKLMPPYPKKGEHQLKNQEEKKKIVIGFFGLLRCQMSWDILSELANRYPQKFEIYIRGYVMGIEDFQEKMNKNKNLIYEGEYVSPRELSDIYSKVDAVWIGNIGNNEENSKIALPNRYYESLYFRKPMIAHLNSAVGNKIENLTLGWTVNFKKKLDAVASIGKLCKKDIVKMSHNIQKVPSEEYLGEKDHENFIAKISERGLL